MRLKRSPPPFIQGDNMSFYEVTIRPRKEGDRHDPMYFADFRLVDASVAITCSRTENKLTIVPSRPGRWRIEDAKGYVVGDIRKVEQGAIYTEPQHL